MAVVDEDWLYVPRAEIAEALALGARLLKGDARLAVPRPLPPGVGRDRFVRWQGRDARYRWCFETVADILDELNEAPPGEAAQGRRLRLLRRTLEELLDGVAAGAAPGDRVYLFVCVADMGRVRNLPGVFWDREARMYFATAEAPLPRLFRYLTPAARQRFEAERLARRTTQRLLEDEARRVVGEDEDQGEVPTAVRKPASGAAGGGTERPAPPAERSPDLLSDLLDTPVSPGLGRD